MKCDTVIAEFYLVINVSLDVPFAASVPLWPNSERKGVDIILFTASAAHLSTVKLW